MSKSDLVSRSMDVSARSIDLLNALNDTIKNPQGIVQLGLEIGRWLGREKLSKRQLQICLEKAKGLARANAQGHEFFQAVSARKIPQRAVGHIFAQPSGSLGRLMANDPYLCWMISSIACLFEFHGEDFISNMLCAFIMQAHLSRDDNVTESQLVWHPLRLQLKPVIDKIVSSVWLNVVNSGVVHTNQNGSLSALPLPAKIKEVCPNGHHLEWHKLSIVLSRLRNVEDETIIQSKHIVFNLTIWLLYHFRGCFRVIVSGKTVYDEMLGQDGSTIEYRVGQFCPAELCSLSGEAQSNDIIWKDWTS